MADKKKIGIMGGTFNPIHMGHLILAETAREESGLDQILFVPSGNSYMKDGAQIAGATHRMEMTRLAILDNPYFELSGMEVDRPGNTYTYETLELLHVQRPEDELYFILGADCLFMMEEWKHPERIFQSCTVLAAVRDDKDTTELEKQIQYLTRKFHARMKLLPMKEFCISSTDIRTRIEIGKSIQYLVPKKVIAYMAKHHIYC